MLLYAFLSLLCIIIISMMHGIKKSCQNTFPFIMMHGIKKSCHNTFFPIKPKTLSIILFLYYYKYDNMLYICCNLQ